MKGMESLMKMMGVDPNEIKNQVENAGKKFNAVIDHFNERLNVIEKTQQEILTLLKKDNQNDKG